MQNDRGDFHSKATLVIGNPSRGVNAKVVRTSRDYSAQIIVVAMVNEKDVLLHTVSIVIVKTSVYP